MVRVWLASQGEVRLSYSVRFYSPVAGNVHDTKILLASLVFGNRSSQRSYDFSKALAE